ncbi:fungal-specific transcription factor domain-containing protein [Plectosphaerella plurivora]|uniref:Fungal-specific transcription factor domain-containing protein n=1 Tax=Plectosphaerella plurivora TaxID=936078 RepID=A0A9P8VEW1_9PEZI|nr:fungal-specific transcription factor domain-containing protein [Plectosphaerella plurivora]
MQTIMSFEYPQRKRRKTLRACQRCKDWKKRCDVDDSRQRSPLEAPEAPNQSFLDIDGQLPRPSPMPFDSLEAGDDRAASSVSHPMVSTTPSTTSTSSLIAPSQPARTALSVNSDHRYATMLSLRQPQALASNPRHKTSKLISGTNPLSALLGKDLKHKIVTNSCSFRTPDPGNGSRPAVPRRGGSVHSYDWQQYYRAWGTSEARLQYLCALDCFTLPEPAQCSQLLEIYFTHIHPVLPILDRKDLLARYYGSGEPPSLVLLHAICLAAYRYLPLGQHIEDGVSEIRTHCDHLHTKLHALVESEVKFDRIAVVQASLLASLHWEGREGLNSAIDNLSIAVRLCQELGFHRKQQDLLASESVEDDGFHRRLWWCTYALDRLNAAQEGTPFLINELDCDVKPLTEEDLGGEDELTRQATNINLSLAHIIEDAVRGLYATGEDHTTLFTSRGVRQRQALRLRLEQVATRISAQLMSGKDLTACGLEKSPPDTAALCGALLLTHVDAVRILVHRPFILHQEPAGSNLYMYASRDACRSHSLDILHRLEYLLSKDLLRFSWPFTVYAVVNALLIFWYDISSPPSTHPSALSEARQSFTSVTALLRAMGSTWWAAAAKHKLAQALAHAAGALPGQGQDQRQEPTVSRHTEPLTPASGHAGQPDDGTGDWLDHSAFEDCASADFWGSIGLDFDVDVASNIFSIGQFEDQGL